MDRPGVRQVPEGSGEQGKMEKTGCKIIGGAPTTLVVKGLMMMMIMKFILFPVVCTHVLTSQAVQNNRVKLPVSHLYGKCSSV